MSTINNQRSVSAILSSAQRRKLFAQMSRYPSVDFEKKFEYSNSFQVDYFDESGKSIGATDKVRPLPEQKLHECLENKLRQRGFSPDRVSFFIENSNTPLPENCNANFLTGQRIVVRAANNSSLMIRKNISRSNENDSSERKSPSRKLSADNACRKSSTSNKQSYRNRLQQHCNSVCASSLSETIDIRSRKISTVSQPALLTTPLDEPSCSEDGSVLRFDSEDTGSRRARSHTSSRRSIFFGKDKIDMITRLTEIKADIQKPVPIFELEDHWTKIVQNSDKLNKKNHEQQEAIWEFITTEHRYLQVLKQMSELFHCLVRIQDFGFLRDIDPRRVFLNYAELYTHNSKFWKKAIMPMLENSRKTGQQLDPIFLKAGFERTDEWWPCYTNFIYGHTDCHTYVQKYQKEHEMFREFVTWAESQNSMQRQRLLDMLTKPMQRLTRYSLLLKAVLKNTLEEMQQEVIQDMINRTEATTRNVEESLTNNDLQNKLVELSRGIESYEFIDTEDFEKIFPIKCSLQLAEPMPFIPGPPQFRRVYLRGDLKIKESRQGTKTDVHCIIFTDLFLICKSISRRSDRLRILKPPMHIAKICLQQFIDSSGFVMSPMNDFGLPTSLYYFFTHTVEETKKWIEMINMALRDFYRLKPLSPQQFLLGYQYGTSPDYLELENNHISEFDKKYSVNQNHFNASLPEIVHRKSCSMDSQIVAEQGRIANMRKVSTVTSVEQLDRFYKDVRFTGHLLSRKKLTVSNAGTTIPNSFLGQSKSSVDLHVSAKFGSDQNEFGMRSRSNSSDQSGTTACTTMHCRSQSTSPMRKVNNEKETSHNSLPDNQEFHEEPSIFEETSPGTIEITPSVDVSHNDLEVLSEEASSSNRNMAGEQNEESFAPVLNNARRFERRYHTSDGIDVIKPKSVAMPPGILKRFSWNVSTAVGGSSKKISNRMNEQQSRRQSQSTVTSSESFSSSTSGFSTASSAIDSTVNETSSQKEDSEIHISTVAIGEKVRAENNCTLRIDLSGSEKVRDNTFCKMPPPPLPGTPPPVIQNKKEKNVPIKKQQELIKFIFDNYLETSDV